MKPTLIDLSDEQLEAVCEKIRAEDNLVKDVEQLKRENRLMMQTITILAHDLNDRLARRNKK